MKKAIAFLGIWLGSGLAGWAAAPTPATTVAAISQLSPEAASRHLPVSFQAVVTYFRSYDHVMFVQDGDSAIYVNAPTGLKLVPGDRVRVRGTTHESFRNYVQSGDVTLLHHGALPSPIQAGYEAMIQGLVDCRLVRVRAVVRSADIVPTSLLLVPATALRLLIDGHQVDAEVGGSDAALLPMLLDAEVEISGVVSGHFDNKMQQTGILFHIQSPDDIRILRPSPADPWSLPVTAMDRAITGFDEIDRTRRTRVHGVITYYVPGSGLVLQDGRQSLWVNTNSFQSLRIGDLADAIGFPDVMNGFLSLTRSEVRDSGIPALVPAPLYTWRELAQGGNTRHGHMYDLVSIEGKVVTEVRQATQDEYVLATDGHLISAIFQHPGSLNRTPLPAMRQIPVGAKVRVTGICMLEDADPFLGDVPFNILLRSFDDISVVAPPPWLNVGHLVELIAVLLAVMFLLVARSWRMERKIRRQTSATAANERRRSQILEAMNASKPLEEILSQICDLLSFQLDQAPCWCEMADGTCAGRKLAAATQTGGIEVHPIPGASGSAIGTLFAWRGAPDKKTREALSRAAGLISLAVETSHLHLDLLHRSEFDLLTEIRNRFAMEKSLDAMIQAAERSHTVFGFIYVDLDEFKAVNDTYGHHVGDLYLQQVSLRMRRQLRPSDMLARLGGDEFAVLVSDVQDRAEVERIARRLKHCFDDPFAVDETHIVGGASIGCSLYPEDGTSRDRLLTSADAAMYAQKRARKQPRLALAGVH